MDYASEQNVRGTDADDQRTGADIRVTNESENEWADLDAAYRGNVRHPYWVHQCQPNADYEGVLDCMDVDEARALFEVMFERFHVYDGLRGFPLPPKGLPGFAENGFDEDDPAALLIRIGVKYALAIVRNERRAMHLRWQDAEDMIRKIEQRAEDGVYLEQARRSVAADMAKAAVPQFVYFIGSQTGPIKIGIAKNVQRRLKELQTSHHEKLEVLAHCDGSEALERRYHKRFKAHRLTGEWFKPARAIRNEIARLHPLPGIIEGLR